MLNDCGRRGRVCRWLLPALAVAGAVATTAEARPIEVCTASDVMAAEPACPEDPVADCSIGGRLAIVQPICTLDFGSRRVTMLPGARLDVGSNAVTLVTGALALERSTRIRARGDSSSPNGGSVTIDASGPVTIASASRIDVRGAGQAGQVLVDAGGELTVRGRIEANGKSRDGLAGSIRLSSVGDASVHGRLAARSGSRTSFGGDIDVIAQGAIELAGPIDVRGGEGGNVGLDAQSDLAVRATINANAVGRGSPGGNVSVQSQLGAALIANRITARGSAGPGRASGDGGTVLITAQNEVSIENTVTTEGAGLDGCGGAIDIDSNDAGIVVTSEGVISIASAKRYGCGGQLYVVAELDIVMDGVIDAVGGQDGGSLDMHSEQGDVAVSGRVDAHAHSGGGNGGCIVVSADAGSLTFGGKFDAGGGGCNPEDGCGDGGDVDLEGCDVTFASGARFLNRGGQSGGRTDVRAGGLVSVESGAVIDNTVSRGPAGANGSVTIHHPGALIPVIAPSAKIRPDASLLATQPECSP